MFMNRLGTLEPHTFNYPSSGGEPGLRDVGQALTLKGSVPEEKLAITANSSELQSGAEDIGVRRGEGKGASGALYYCNWFFTDWWLLLFLGILDYLVVGPYSEEHPREEWRHFTRLVVQKNERRFLFRALHSDVGEGEMVPGVFPGHRACFVFAEDSNRMQGVFNMDVGRLIYEGERFSLLDCVANVYVRSAVGSVGVGSVGGLVLVANYLVAPRHGDVTLASPVFSNSVEAAQFSFPTSSVSHTNIKLVFSPDDRRVVVRTADHRNCDEDPLYREMMEEDIVARL